MKVIEKQEEMNKEPFWKNPIAVVLFLSLLTTLLLYFILLKHIEIPASTFVAPVAFIIFLMLFYFLYKHKKFSRIILLGVIFISCEFIISISIFVIPRTPFLILLFTFLLLLFKVLVILFSILVSFYVLKDIFKRYR